MCTVAFAITQCNCNIENGGAANYNGRYNAPGYAHPHE